MSNEVKGQSREAGVAGDGRLAAAAVAVELVVALPFAMALWELFWHWQRKWCCCLRTLSCQVGPNEKPHGDKCE